MAYVIDGERYTDTEARAFIKDNFSPYLAIEFYDLNYGPMDVGYATFDVNDIIRGLIAIGRIDERRMFDDFVNELLKIVRDGRLDSYDLPYDIEGMDISYLPTKSASPGSGRTKSYSSKPKSGSKASKPRTTMPKAKTPSKAPKTKGRR